MIALRAKFELGAGREVVPVIVLAASSGQGVRETGIMIRFRMIKGVDTYHLTERQCMQREGLLDNRRQAAVGEAGHLLQRKG